MWEVAILRIKIILEKENLVLPLAYQSILQGVIYSMIQSTKLGDYYHDVGYQFDKKVFKCFVFSNIFGKYTVENNHLIIQDEFYFYLSSQDEKFIKVIYQYLTTHQYLMIQGEKVKIKLINTFEPKYFSDIKLITIKTLSPMLIYSTKNDFSIYYTPSDDKANQYILNNLIDKSRAYGYPMEQVNFQIKKVDFEKRRMVKYKHCVYPAYLTQMQVEVDYNTLSFIYNCGLSSKNSAGFGMIEIINEKGNLSI